MAWRGMERLAPGTARLPLRCNRTWRPRRRPRSRRSQLPWSEHSEQDGDQEGRADHKQQRLEHLHAVTSLPCTGCAEAVASGRRTHSTREPVAPVLCCGPDRPHDPTAQSTSFGHRDGWALVRGALGAGFFVRALDTLHPCLRRSLIVLRPTPVRSLHSGTVKVSPSCVTSRFTLLLRPCSFGVAQRTLPGSYPRSLSMRSMECSRLGLGPT